MGSNAILETPELDPHPYSQPHPRLQKKFSLISQTSQLSLNPSNPSAVLVKNANKTYSDKVPVLKAFNMNVPSGAIYSLLGASGCGKTTMLSCIVGTLKLDSGDVFVFGQRPGSKGSGIPGRCIGYMPQGVTLYAALSIKETLEYFGRLYGMTKIEIQSRIEFLVSFLDLPSAFQLVGTLSGGQQRRTSLAACLLHEPSLLILDEPTVGVDPLMRETIWKHLRDITRRKQTTVIITTHYMEEAKNGQRVGLMRNGHLLIEDSPRALLRAHNSPLLEDIVLKLCQKDENSINLKKQQQLQRSFQNDEFDEDEDPDEKFNPSQFKQFQTQLNPSEEDDNVVGLTFKEKHKEFDQISLQSSILEFDNKFIPQFYRPVKFENASWIRKITALFIRNMLLFLRNPKTLYLAFLAPAFHVIVVNTTVGPLPKFQKFGVVVPEINYDPNVCSNVVGIGCSFDYLSCSYINLLSKSAISPIYFRSKEEALESIVKGNSVGFMYFHQNYTRQLVDRFVAGRFAMGDSLAESNIEIKVDTTNYFTAILLKKDLYETFQVFAKELMIACEFPVYLAELPLKMNAIYGTIGSKYEEYISPGVLILITFIIPAATAGYSLINDRNQGTLDRTMVAGATAGDILTAHYLSEFLLILVQTGITYSVVVFVFQWEIQCSNFIFITIIILTGMAGVSGGTCLVQTVGELYEGIFLILGYFMYSLFYTGILWPLQSSPLGARIVSWFFPCSWILESFRSLIGRGWSVTHQNVWPGFAVLISAIIIFWIITLRIWRVRL